MLNLAKEITNGRRLTRTDDLSIFINCPLDELCTGADIIRKHFCGEKVDLCTIINGKSGKCGEDCKYCAQSCHNSANIDNYDFLPIAEIITEAISNEKDGVNRFSIVTAGRTLTDSDFQKIVTAYKELKAKTNLSLCASHGLLSRKQFRLLRQAGVTTYHSNIETSKRYFPYICTTHTYDDKIKTIKIALSEGLRVCSGGIIGMGEEWEDRLDMAVSLAELNIQSIPINALTPIPGTPMENMKTLTEDEILRTAAFFRYINPTANIRLAAGRKLMTERGKRAFQSGVSAAITGNMLTTSGSTVASDRRMLKELGREII